MEYVGNIYRPPGEARSFLLQATIGCSHNKCTFCDMYREKKFRIRKTEDILRDIYETASLYNKFEKIFLCDGDAIIIPTEELLEILKALKKCFPYARLISTYAGPKSTLAKSPDELAKLRAAGLGRAYLGVESGSDKVLKHINKGVDAETMLKAGLALKDAGINLWIMILIGIGGREGSEEHVKASTEIVQKMRPDHMSCLNYIPVRGTPLYDEIQAGTFKLIDAEESLIETRYFIENLDVEKMHFTSDHASNYLPLKGTLKEDREKLLKLIDGALSGRVGMRSEYMRGI
jgi:radical SAM superfamily enzyme YgiQ (UPF0313 family)